MLVKNFSIDSSEEQMLAELAETLLPATDTPGAKDIYAHLFALKMIDDCSTKEEQEKFVKGMKSFEKASAKKLSASFLEASPDQRLSYIKELNQREEKDDLQYFFRSMKRLTVQAYTSSRYFLTNVKVYELVPGRWHGCFPVKAAGSLS